MLKRAGLHQLLHLALGAFLFFAGGCFHYGQPGGASFVSITVTNTASDSIRLAVASVFTKAGFTAIDTARDSLSFQRNGTERDQMAYGTWMGGNVVIRASVAWRPNGTNAFLLECNPVIVRNTEDPRFEEKQRISRMRRAEYGELLTKVAATLVR